ncbi:aconitate hydratase [Enterocloster lavalensis]|uniref:aconitate hydratase n=1 Tax=Enterocloster lavalensis TaxID=460384 RepID=UPI00140C90C4|nr:aconitate hydratase [Enterocloster lavalensis]MBS5607380.1 aconitate hydratase [Enterocloster asparagiformis]MCB6345335.1 aconitate hydratase [Enterocloster lavalensis]
MNMNLTKKILAAHLAKPSDMVPGEEIFLKVDQTLTHDINAVMTYLAFEAIGLDRTQVETSVSYLDHNLLYLDNKTPDDHIYLQSVAKRYGVYVSRPGNGICHAVQVARFGAPGKLSMGGDSHTPHGGAIGMLCIGVGGMDVATAMTGVPMRLKMPQVIKVNLTGHLKPGCNAKEVILEMLRRVGIKGGLGKVFEYVGPGAATLTVNERATISNMGAEMGATTSIFPADEQVRKFLKAQKREADFVELTADEGCSYDGEMELNLSELVPLCACPHQPDNVIPLKDVEKKKVQQVFIGSCTNASYSDIAKAALVFQGRHVHEDVSCTCGISSKQIYLQLMKDGYLEMLLNAGVRLLELACGPCCAIGQSPATKGVAVRTSNRNFKGRAGNPTAEIYLVNPESAAATAIMGTFASAEEILGDDIVKLADIQEPEEYPVDDSMIVAPLSPEEAREVEVVRGPNIKPLPVPDAPEQHLKVQISLKTVDNITTDDITPASAEFSSMRSNIPLMSQYCYHRYDPSFAERARQMGQSIIIGGENYGQGSSREHAAINPMYLGVKAVIAKSIARIHKGNLLNHGIIPMIFADPADYDRVDMEDTLEIHNLLDQMQTREVEITDVTKDFTFKARLELSDSELEVISCGGQLRYLKRQLEEMGR